MSFVSVIANKDVITVVTDGRVVNRESKEVINESYKKYVKLSKKQFIAYSGIKEACESVVDQIEYAEEKVYDLNQVSEEIYNAIVNHEGLADYDLLFAVGGVSPEGHIEFHTINRRENELKSYKPKSVDDFNYAYLYTSQTNLDLENKLREIAGQIGTGSVNKRLKIQKRLNDFVADHDETVNKITFDLRVRRN